MASVLEDSRGLAYGKGAYRMIRLVGGPPMDARGVTVRRYPLYLRIVCSRAGIAHALDRVDAKPPYAEEKVYAFRRAEKITDLYPDPASNWEDGTVVVTQVYRFVQPQPEAAILRSNEKWQEWCLEQVKPTETKP